MRGAEKLVFVRNETALLQWDAEVWGLLVRGDCEGGMIGFQELPAHVIFTGQRVLPTRVSAFIDFAVRYLALARKSR